MCLACYAYQDFAHRSLRQSRECRFHILEAEDTVHDRPLSHGIQTTDDLLPDRLGRRWRIVSDRDPAHAIPPEEQHRGVKLRHHAATPPNDADTAALAEHAKHVVEQHSAD